jgi:hypothetical protein
MGINTKDTDVLQLLKQLKNANGPYPQELLAARRQGYLKQVAEISGGVGLAAALRTTVKSAQGSGSLPAAGTLLEGLLVVAIVAEASTVAYFYRDKIRDLYQSITNSPRVEEVSSPPVLPSPIADFEFTVTPMPTGTVTVTETPVITPSLLSGQPTQNNGNGTGEGTSASASGSTSEAVATEEPHEDNGNHYGLTPKPERTIEPDNNNNSESNTQNNRPESKRNK